VNATEDKRPTLVPEFDPEAFARESELAALAPPPVPAVAPARATLSEEPTIDEARRLLEDGDPEQALFILGRLLEVLPLHTEAAVLSDECRVALERQYVERIGALSSVLVVAVSPAELTEFGLDHLSGFLLSLIDGHTDVETVVDLSGRPRLLALKHLASLVSRGILQHARR